MNGMKENVPNEHDAPQHKLTNLPKTRRKIDGGGGVFPSTGPRQSIIVGKCHQVASAPLKWV